MEFDTRPQLEGPGLEVVRRLHDRASLGWAYALVVENGERFENRGDAAVNAAVSKTPTFSGSKPGISSSSPTVMLPPLSARWPGRPTAATPNPATRKMRANALEPVPATH